MLSECLLIVKWYWNEPECLRGERARAGVLLGFDEDGSVFADFLFSAEYGVEELDCVRRAVELELPDVQLFSPER